MQLFDQDKLFEHRRYMKFTQKGEVFVSNIYFDQEKNVARSETEYDHGVREDKHYTTTQDGWEFCKQLLARGWEEVDVKKQEAVEVDLAVADKLVAFFDTQAKALDGIIAELEKVDKDLAQPSRDMKAEMLKRKAHVEAHIPQMKKLKRHVILKTQ